MLAQITDYLFGSEKSSPDKIDDKRRGQLWTCTRIFHQRKHCSLSANNTSSKTRFTNLPTGRAAKAELAAVKNARDALNQNAKITNQD